MLTDQNFYFRWKEPAALEALSIFSTASVSDVEDKIPLYLISGIENQMRGIYVISWLKVDKHGNPKVNKRGEYKTYHFKYRLLKNKGEDKFKFLERREQFGYFLLKAIKNLKTKTYLTT